MNKSTTIHELVSPYVLENPQSHRLGLKFAETRIDVFTSSQELRDKLKNYYRDFLSEQPGASLWVTAIEAEPPVLDIPYTRKPPEPGKTRIKEEFADFADGRVVRKLLTGLLFFFGKGDNYAVGPCLANDNQIVNFINNRFIEKELGQGALLFHSSGVSQNGSGIAISGFAGAGKSTLALEIMRLGTTFVSNDRVMVAREDDGLCMSGVAKMPRVNPGTVLNNESLRPVMSEEDRAKFSALPEAELWDLEHKYDAFIDECFGPGRFSLKAKMAGLVILNWKRDGSSVRHARVKLGQRRDLMASFMKDTGLFFNPDELAVPYEASEEDYLKLLGDVPVLELSGGVNFVEAAPICLDFLSDSSK